MDLGTATLIGAGVSAIAILISQVISNRNIKNDFNTSFEKMNTSFEKINTLFEKMFGKQNKLNEQHGNNYSNLGKEHNQILEKQNEIKATQKKIDEKISCVEKMLVEEKREEKFRYSNLTDKQKDIMTSIDNIKAMAEEIKNLQEKITVLKIEKDSQNTIIDELRKNNEMIKDKIEEVTKKNEKLQEKIIDLEAENIDLKKELKNKLKYDRGMQR